MKKIRLKGMPVASFQYQRIPLLILVAGLSVSSCARDEAVTDPIGETGTAETTRTTVDPRRGAPLRADADPWPQDFDDVVPGVWYQFDLNMNECSAVLWLPNQTPNKPGETVYVEQEPIDASAFVGIPHARGVARINADGQLEYTADRVQAVRLWVPRPASEFKSFLCD